MSLDSIFTEGARFRPRASLDGQYSNPFADATARAYASQREKRNLGIYFIATGLLLGLTYLGLIAILDR